MENDLKKINSEEILLELKNVKTYLISPLSSFFLFPLFLFIPRSKVPDSIDIRNILITNKRIVLPIVSHERGTATFSSGYNHCMIFWFDKRDIKKFPEPKDYTFFGNNGIIDYRNLDGDNLTIAASYPMFSKIQIVIEGEGKKVEAVLERIDRLK